MRKVFEFSLLTLALLYIALQCVAFFNTKNSSGKQRNAYRGTQFWNPEKTVAVKTLHETPFAHFQIHSVHVGMNRIDDWLWCDEMNAANVLVHETETDKYILFRQTAYGIPGAPTLAVVGGLVDGGEDPLNAAKREVMNELQMESKNWVPLGTYRVASNHGVGIISTFLAKNATKIVSSRASTVEGQTDLKRAEIVKCTEEELLEYILEGKLGDIKWAATAALSILKLRSNRDQGTPTPQAP